MQLLRFIVLQATSRTVRLLPDQLKTVFYKIPVLSGGLRWVLTKAAPEGRVVMQVASGIGRGIRLRLDLKTQKYYWLGTHEVALQRALQREACSGMTVYDVGANVGFFALVLARLVGTSGKVYAFEPLPENVRVLRENVSLNAGQVDNVRVVEAAVANVSGVIRLYPHLSSSQACVLRPAHGGLEGHEVESLTLDEYVYTRKEPAPHMVKLDIEGAEGSALTGARRLLSEARPVCMIEIHGEEAARTVWEELQRASYVVMNLERNKEFKGPTQFARGHVLAIPR